MMKTTGLWLVVGALSVPAAVMAAPQLDLLYGDHAVIQRGQPVTITGSATAGEAVTVKLGAATATAVADAAGRFKARFDPVNQAGPIALSVDAPSGQTVANDVQMGDVFLCSGQSNMELPVKNAQNAFGQFFSSNDPDLRLMTVEKRVAFTPDAAFLKPVAWQLAGPKTVQDFSANCYYMIKDLRKTEGVPIGAINSSWGGTQISPWMGEAALAEVGLGARSDLLKLYDTDRPAAELAANGIWEDWWRQNTGDKAGNEPWQPQAKLTWKPVPAISVWQQWKEPALASYVGMVWFRREIEVSAADAGQAAVLNLGGLDDLGMAWINGTSLGGAADDGRLRTFSVPKGVLMAGKNVIIVNINNTYADGGMRGPAEAMKLAFEGGASLSLADSWVYAIAATTPKNPPHTPWEDMGGAGTAYNGMIAPLGVYKFKGVAWYQGESDTDFPGYEGRLKAMAADWRRQFQQADLPFVIIELSGYGKPAVKPSESGWANVRDAERRMAVKDGHAAFVSTIDLGDPLDIHPGEKEEVGRRMARAMRALAYGSKLPASGPLIESATAEGGDVILRFSDVTGTLQTRSSSVAIGFELCGEGVGTCRYALATAQGAAVRLKGDGQPVTRVRYGWADYPVVNLFDEAQLPVSTFETPVTK
ncbi:MAG: sialate O-acetylesterase [Asticcacaulis sp.]